MSVRKTAHRRALRRHHKERMKAKARHICTKIWREKNLSVIKRLTKNADNLKMCSCEMCRNPRRSGWYKGKRGWTLKEIQAEKDLRTNV